MNKNIFFVAPSQNRQVSTETCRIYFFTITGERITLIDGNVLFLVPKCAYSIIPQNEFKHYTVNFDIHEASSSLDILDKPYSLLNEKNTEQIERELKELISVWSVKKCGFEDTSYFARFFKQKTGIAPGEYKKRF